MPVKSATAGQCATLLLKKMIDKEEKGSNSCQERDGFVFSRSSSFNENTTASQFSSSISFDEGIFFRAVKFIFFFNLFSFMQEDEWTVEEEREVDGIWGKRVGMVLLPSSSNPIACWTFTAELLIVNHPSVIRINYEPVVHAENIRQSARLLSTTSVVRRIVNTSGKTLFLFFQALFLLIFFKPK